MSEPCAIILINGKRKCGKDYLALELVENLGPAVCETLHLSTEIKREYAQLNNLDFSLLLTDSPYKDVYRKEMIALGEARRGADPGHYCRLATEHGSKQCWVVVDNRRETDIEYFKQQYPGKCIVVRVTASEEIRRKRGWSWKSGVDDAESECGLDKHVPDIPVCNNGDILSDGFLESVELVVRWVKERLTI
ncbi:phosphomevalonate kinase-like [Bolinopsis microptera]|uniref:phosphomevalonate kinase-like n=1 Tax=Bolinopsis microptera TaxID=2820187 RepID=UPI003078C074